MPTIKERIDTAVDFIRKITDATPSIGLVLGSGLGDFTDQLENQVIVPFSDIPDFPVTTVEGHVGCFVFGIYDGKSVVALKGRVHYYEGYTQQEITMPIRIMSKLGVKSLMLTNAAGGVNLSFSEGALMLITDHINYSGSNPLIGANIPEFGVRFPDMTDIYTKTLRNTLKDAVSAQGISLSEGVYAMYSGPNYETPAEIRFFRTAGADAVGMSTVPEAIIACHCGMQVIGISCITNMAAGVLDRKLDHSEVVDTANRVKADFTNVLKIAIGIM